MKSYEVMWAFRKRAGAKMVAAAVGLAKSHTDKWCRPVGAGETGELNPLDRVAQMLTLPGGLELVKWLCRKADGFFVRNPALKVWRTVGLFKATCVLVGCIAKFQARLSQAELDGRISPEEAQELREAWEELKSEGESFVSACERGAFRCWAVWWPFAWWSLTGEVLTDVTVAA